MALNQFGAGFIFNAVDQASAIFDKVGSNFRKLGGDVNRISGQIGAGFREVSGQVAIFGAAITGAAVVAGWQMAKASGEASTFSRELIKLSTIANGATMPMDRLREIVTGAAIEFGESPIKEAQSLYLVLKAGIMDVTKAVDVLNAANRVSEATGADVTVVVDGLTNALNAYGPAGLTAADAADIYFTAMRVGKLDMEELQGTAGRLIPTAARMKIGLDEVFSALSALKTSGFETRESVMTLRAMLQQIGAPSKEAQAEARRLGIEFSTAALRSKGLVGFLSDIKSSAGYSTESMERLFRGLGATNAIMALTADGGGRFNTVLEQMRNRGGTTEAAMEKISQAFGHTKEEISATGEVMRTSFGESINRILMPLLRDTFLPILKSIQSTWAAIPEESRDVIVKVAMALVALAGAAGGILVVSGAVGKFFGSIRSFIGLAVGFLATLVLLPVVLGAVAGGAVALYAAFKGLTAHLGMAGLSWEDLGKKAGLAFRAISDLFTKGTLSDSVKVELDKVENSGVARLVQGFERLADKLRAFWDGLKRGFAAGVAALDFGPLKERFGWLLGVFSDDATGAALAQWTAGGEAAGKALANMGQRALEAFTVLVDWGGQAVGWLKGLTAADVQAGINELIAGFRTFKSVLDGIWTVMKGIWWFMSMFVGMYRNLAAAGAWLGETMAEMPVLQMPAGMAAGTTGAQLYEQATAGARPEVAYRGMRPGGNRVGALRSEAQDIGAWIAGAGRYATPQAGRTGFTGAAPAMQAEWIAKLNQINETLKQLGDRPVVVKTPDERVLFRSVERGREAAAGGELNF